MASASPKRTTKIGAGLALVMMLTALPLSLVQAQGAPLVVPPSLIPPPLSVSRAQFFENNPQAWSQLLSQLPRRAHGPPIATAPRTVPAYGGTWQTGNNFLPDGVFISNPLLLTDGTVIAENENTPEWYRLTPDNTGSYVNGTWSPIASMPVIDGTQYAPLYYASAVLPDGRVLVMGGEYNAGVGDHTNMGAIYDPLADSWTAVAPPTGPAWFAIGDAQSAVLADGTFLLAACCAGSPTGDALFDATTLGWTATGGPSNSYSYSYQDEQGYNLLPNGNVLTIDIWDNYPGNTTNAEQYVPSSGTWISAGKTPVSLADPAECGSWEIGPAALRADGTLVAFGGNTGCISGQTADPTAIFDSSNGTWSAGPNVLAVCGSSATSSCTLADAPAALLPNGNVLFAASAGTGAPVHFFEFTAANSIEQVADTVYFASTSVASSYNFLVLPTGQIFSTDFSNAPEFYTPTGSAQASWAPVIATAPSIIAAGSSYQLTGTQLNGLSQGAYFGDDVQGSTNYPLLQIINTATGHVFYARTSGFSTMSIAPGASGSANFTVPADVEAGPGKLVVIANGIASTGVSVTVLGSTTTALAAAPTSASFGAPVVFTATVSSSAGTPKGKVTFKSGNIILGSATLSGGAASLTATTLAVGTDSITAKYDGSAVFSASTSPKLSEVIGKATSTVTLGSSKNPSAFGQSVIFTATAAPQYSGTPTGKVTFKNGTTSLGSATLSDGVATLATTTLSVGSKSITAVYAGSASFAASTSQALSQSVDQATSTVTLTSSQNPSTSGQSVTFTATVAPEFGGTPSGKVAFRAGSSLLGDVTLTGGLASFSTSSLSSGKHVITAKFAGSTDFSASSGTLTQTVQ